MFSWRKNSIRVDGRCSASQSAEAAALRRRTANCGIRKNRAKASLWLEPTPEARKVGAWPAIVICQCRNMKQASFALPGIAVLAFLLTVTIHLQGQDTAAKTS